MNISYEDVALCHKTALDNGFWDGAPKEGVTPEYLLAKIALIHSELGEATEAIRKDNYQGGKGCMAEELADTIIRIFDLAEFMGFDIIQNIKHKMSYNMKRPYLHGKTC